MAQQQTPSTGRRMVGFKDSLGTALIGLGLMALLLPWGAETVAALEFVEGDRFGILTGMVFMLGIGTVIAGFAVYRLRDRR